ncbi:MAG: response regulator [Candidatus Methylomirabilales bacterium]
MLVPTILIIDDDKLIRWSLSTMLGRAGYRIREAATGKEGLAAVESGTPDLVLLDIMLPDMDGLAVLEVIRHAHPELPVLTMTADSTPETVRQALRLGAGGHLEKPCDSAALLAAVSEALQSITPPGQISQ